MLVLQSGDQSEPCVVLYFGLCMAKGRGDADEVV